MGWMDKPPKEKEEQEMSYKETVDTVTTQGPMSIFLTRYGRQERKTQTCGDQ